MKRYAVTVAVTLLVVLNGFASLRASSVSYTVENLGTTVDGFVPTITGMNASGQVSGYVNIGSGLRAVRYTNGVGWQYVAGLQSIYSVATGINASGSLSGYEIGAQGFRAFRFVDGSGVTVLGALSGGTFSVGLAINDNGDVVGYGNSSTASMRAWKSAAGTTAVVALPGLPGSTMSKACGINVNGWIAGMSDTTGGFQHAYRISPSNGTEDLGSLDGQTGSSTACAIDEFARVGGNSSFGSVTHAFRYDQAPMIDVDSFGSPFSTTNAVANSVSVGSFTFDPVSGDLHAFAQSGTDSSVDLNNQLVSSNGWVLTEALAVNSNGQIAGDGSVNGVFGVFRLTPQAGDTTPPVIAPHADVTAEATSASGASVSYTPPTTTDNVDGAGTATCLPAPGSMFALGSTLVTCNAKDAAGNAAAPTTFNVVVQDTTPPVIAPHADVTASATSASGAGVSYTSPSTTDAVDGTGTANCTPASGTTFALGATTVTCNAKDAAGNAAAATMFSVIVKDTTPPVIAAHADVTAEATSSNGASVSYSAPSTTDNVDGTGTASCTPASGTTFALGTTPVTCNAKDAAGNAATPTTFNVVVKDTTPPVIAPHADVTASATGSGGASVAYVAPLTSDAVDGTRTASCAPASGSTFPLGASTVTCTATDAAGNVAVPTTFRVIVQDTTAPVISMVYASPDTIWPPNGKMVPVSVMVTATDNVDPSPSCALTSITGGAAGSSAVTGTLSGNLRADGGAVYTLTVTCRDFSGNSSSAAATVVVGKINGANGTPKTFSRTSSTVSSWSDDDRDDRGRGDRGRDDDRGRRPGGGR